MRNARASGKASDIAVDVREHLGLSAVQNSGTSNEATEPEGASGTVVVRHPHGEPSDLIRSVSRALRVLEAVGQTPRGLTVKQIARRCELTTATTYHLIRTLAYEGYVARREDGTYVVGLEIADRFRELVAAFRGPASVDGRAAPGRRRHRLQPLPGHVRRRPGRHHQRGRGTAVAAHGGPGPGFDDGAHATALGKALLATLTHDQRLRYLKDRGMRIYTPATLTQPEALEADLIAGDRRGMQIEISQFRPGSAAPPWWCTPTAIRSAGWCWPAR